MHSWISKESRESIWFNMVFFCYFSSSQLLIWNTVLNRQTLSTFFNYFVPENLSLGSVWSTKTTSGGYNFGTNRRALTNSEVHLDGKAHKTFLLVPWQLKVVRQDPSQLPIPPWQLGFKTFWPPSFQTQSSETCSVPPFLFFFGPFLPTCLCTFFLPNSYSFLYSNFVLCFENSVI